MEKEKEVKKAVIKKRIDVEETLKNIEVGETVYIDIVDIKCSCIRNAVQRLKQKGLSFNISEAGLITSTMVTRIK